MASLPTTFHSLRQRLQFWQQAAYQLQQFELVARDFERQIPQKFSSIPTALKNMWPLLMAMNDHYGQATVDLSEEAQTPELHSRIEAASHLLAACWSIHAKLSEARPLTIDPGLFQRLRGVSPVRAWNIFEPPADEQPEPSPETPPPTATDSPPLAAGAVAISGEDYWSWMIPEETPPPAEVIPPRPGLDAQVLSGLTAALELGPPEAVTPAPEVRPPRRGSLREEQGLTERPVPPQPSNIRLFSRFRREA